MDNDTFGTKRDGKGTKEWSDFSYNICLGCEHDCLYCYAKAQRCRFDEAVRLPGGWAKQKLNPNRSRLGEEVGPKGVVMFPTSHDITPQFLEESLRTIKNLLECNQVLIVSKPHLEVIRRLCQELRAVRTKVMFRFTIGALDKALCAYWEPGAPSPQERLVCLRHAYEEGFQTSVSVEPMLASREETLRLVAEVSPCVTDSVWIGKMQRIPQKHNTHVAGFAEAVALIKSQQSDAEILALVKRLKNNAKVQWKDSIKEVIARCR